MRGVSKRALIAIAVAALVVALGLGLALREAHTTILFLPPPATDSAASAAPEPSPLVPSDGGPEPPALPAGFADVDLDAVRAALPDNTYWRLAAPTSDPELLAERERAAALRNELYGKVLSGTGSDEEIVAYFDERSRTGADYVAFAEYLLEHSADQLTDQDLTLLHVARRLQLARLEEIPRKLQEARERRSAQEEARRAWRESERAFAGEDDASDSESAP